MVNKTAWSTSLFLLFLIAHNVDLNGQVFPRYCPPGSQFRQFCPPSDFCPPGTTESSGSDSNLVNPNQFLNPGQTNPPTADPNLNLQPGMDSFAFNPGAGESGGVGRPGNIAGNQFISSSNISGGSYNNQNDAVGFTVPVAGGDRRIRLSDHFSPFPATRIFYNYHLFGNAGIDISGNDINVNRHTFGFEQSFFGDLASIEMKIPMVSGVSSNQLLPDPTRPLGQQRSTKLGNITISSKMLLLLQQDFAISSGLAVQLPTAPNGQVFLEGFSDPIVKFHNQTINIIPFFAVNLNPTPQSWITFFTQVDFAATGDRVSSFVDDRVSGSVSTTPLLSQKYNQQHLLSLDIAFGNWFFENPGGLFVQRVASFVELHYTSTMNDTDTVVAGNVNPSVQDTLSNGLNRVDLLDATVGFRAQLGPDVYLTAAYVAPLRVGAEKPFDGEFNLNFSRFFGGGGRVFP